MERDRPKSRRVGRFGRAALLLGVATATAGAMVLSAGAAHAAVGKNPGAVSLSPANGPTSGTPTWATTVGCSTGFQGSAVFRMVNSTGSTFSISGGTNSAAAPINPGPALLGTISFLQSLAGIANGGTTELVVVCFSGASETGTSDPEMDTFITFSADGSSYTTSATGPAGAVNTTTALSASPNPAQVGATVTLTATVTAASGTPAGSVQFEAGGTNIGSAVPISATGVATTTTTFAAAATEALSAVFTPTSATAFNPSTGTFSETVTTANPNSGSEPIAVTVPASGSFTLTIAPGTVNLAVSGSTGTGALNPITVVDTRNTVPGWSVTGQESNFTGSGTAAGSTISGNQLGWVPTDTSLGDTVVLGGTVTPAAPGLGTTAATLASAVAGHGTGTSVLGANLTLAIPPAALAGPYTGSLTVTAVTSGP